MDVETILNRMESMELIRLSRPVGDYYQVYCPIHSGGQEKKPSCGVLLHDQVKNGRKYPAGFCHCFRADTRVITNQGSLPIGELCDVPDIQILNGNGEWEPTIFRKYGSAPLWKIELSKDLIKKTIYATGNHEWFVDGVDTLKTTETLPIGKYLQSLVMNPQSFTLNSDAVVHGIIYGDCTRNIRYAAHRHGRGVRTYDKTDPRAVTYTIRIPKFLKKKKLLGFFQNNELWHISDLLLRGKEYWRIQSKSFPLSHNYKQVPSMDLGRDYLMSFLAGYFACDGSIDLMKFHSANPEDLNKIRDICIRCGISVLDMRIQQHNTNYLENAVLASFRMYPKSLPQEFYLLDDPVQSKYSRARWKIVSVKPTNLYEDVYCCETSTQSFVLDGNILTHNCFSCGWAKSLPDTITEILKIKHISQSGLDWLKENIPDFDGEVGEFDYLIPTELAQTLQSKYAVEYIAAQLQKQSGNYVSEEELASYRLIVPYMYQRGLTDEIIEKYDIGYDANFIPPGRKKPLPCITFPVKDIKGNVLFLCRRSVEGKFFHYPQGVEKSVYGLYELPQGVKSVVVAESCFNALTSTIYGYPAVALLGTGTSYEISQLKRLGVQEFVLCLDGDEAGQKGMEKLKKALRSVALVWTIKMPADKDINDCTKEEFDRFYATRE